MTGPIALLILSVAAQAPAPQPRVTVTNSVNPSVATPGYSGTMVAAPIAPPPRASGPHIVRGPQERGTTQSYVSIDDYPAAARDAKEQGRVGFTLTIDASGRVIGCTITQSSGSSALDAATCRIMQRRARYTPAVDSNGNPVVGTIAQQIEWKYPGP